MKPTRPKADSRRPGLRFVACLLMILEMLSVQLMTSAQAEETVRLGFLNGFRRR